MGAEWESQNIQWLTQRGTAATVAKSLQSCPTLCDPIDSSPPGFPIPGILQARVLEWGAMAFSETRGLGGCIAGKMTQNVNFGFSSLLFSGARQAHP